MKRRSFRAQPWSFHLTFWRWDDSRTGWVYVTMPAGRTLQIDIWKWSVRLTVWGRTKPWRKA